MLNRLRVAALACLLPAMISCYGSFDLTRTVYKWNGGISDSKWGVWGVFLVLNIIPVYAATLLVDSLVMNSVEFWTGERPFAGTASAPTSQVVQHPDGSVTLSRHHGDYRVVALSETEVQVLKDGVVVGLGIKTANGDWQPVRAPSNP